MGVLMGSNGWSGLSYMRMGMYMGRTIVVVVGMNMDLVLSQATYHIQS